MKKTALFLTCIILAVVNLLFVSVYADTEIDDSSYESLFRAAYTAELRGDSAYPDPKTLEALVRYDRVDLIFEVISPYDKNSAKEEWRQYPDMNIVKTPAIAIAEQLFRAGRIDEGVELLQKLLPPQEKSDGMLCGGYVSDALLEQKRFGTAWKIADSGPLQEKAENVSRMIHRLIAKTRYEKEPYTYSHTPKLPPWQPNVEDNPIYRKEAENGFKRLEEIYAQITDERMKEWTWKGTVAGAMVVLGRYDDAYKIVENDPKYRFNILSGIVEDCFQRGDKDGLERWFKLFRDSFEKAEHGWGIDYDGRMHYLWPCIRIGKYLDALDVIEKNPPPPGRSGIGGSVTYMYRAYEDIAKENVETGFRHNSTELLERLVKYHGKTKEPEQKKPVQKGNQKVFMFSGSSYNADKFFANILMAQLHLGQLDAALESFKKIEGVIESCNAMAGIAVYCVKNKSPKEIERIEKQLRGIFAEKEEAKRDGMVEWYTVDFLAETAARLLADGNAEAGKRYLERAVEQAEMCHRRSEKKEKTKSDSSSNLGTVCGKLLEYNMPDEAVALVERFPQYTMATTRLAITKKYADRKETEKTKDSLRKTFAVYSKTKHFFPPQFNSDYGAMASLAVDCNDKELFYQMLDEGLKHGEKHRWFGSDAFTAQAFDAYARGLATYGDKDHRLFDWAEKIGDGFKGERYPGNLYDSLAIARSMLGDHVNARRLLKKGIKSREGLKMFRSDCSLVIEAASHEKKRE